MKAVSHVSHTCVMHIFSMSVHQNSVACIYLGGNVLNLS